MELSPAIKYPNEAMTRFASTFALLASAAALQLSLLGNALACPMPSGGSAVAAITADAGTAAPMADMADMDMSSGDGTSGPHSAPCEDPSVPLACMAMAACGSAVDVAIATTHRRVASHQYNVRPGEQLAPASITAQPELPPPRA